MKNEKDSKDRRRHPRVPVIQNIVEPIDLVYTDDKTGTQTVVPAVLADLSLSGMRLVSFLKAPVAGNMNIKMELPFIGGFSVSARTTWVRQKGPVYTMGIEFTEIHGSVAAKIQAMADDFNDCNTRIMLRLPEVCVPNCKANALCNKIQKDEMLFK
ncbi:MAG: PilZ domain-containing protein [Elusimicrobiota bacterium]|jgi:c-di-GMP-binding flagellar brake protein YcgR|nr:PilZ domain-containing protein [Elusimicrobiota bacterium]